MTVENLSHEFVEAFAEECPGVPIESAVAAVERFDGRDGGGMWADYIGDGWASVWPALPLEARLVAFTFAKGSMARTDSRS